MKLKPETLQYLLSKNVNYYVLRELGVSDQDLTPREMALSKINRWDELCHK